MKKSDICKRKGDESKGLLAGIVAGIIPHIGCIAFIVFTLLGITFLSSLFKQFLILKWAFPLMILLSFLLAGISSFFYLKRNCCVNKTKYLSILFSSVILINFLLYFVIFPATANLSGSSVGDGDNTKLITLQVNIPCSGHAPLIIDELKKLEEVKSVSYRTPNYFDVECDSSLDEEKLLSMDIFKEFPCKIVEL